MLRRSSDHPFKLLEKQPENDLTLAQGPTQSSGVAWKAARGGPPFSPSPGLKKRTRVTLIEHEHRFGRGYGVHRKRERERVGESSAGIQFKQDGQFVRKFSSLSNGRDFWAIGSAAKCF